jgi:hypothetical protein
LGEVRAGSDSGATWRFLVLVTSGSFGVGIFAFAADMLEGLVGAIAMALTSSGFAWGLIAYVIGYCAPSRVTAVAGSTMVLLLGTLTYYALVLWVSQRWRGGVLDDGSPADAAGIASVGRAIAYWVAASLLIGPLCGVVADLTRRGTNLQGSITAGMVFGALSAHGWYLLLFVGAWRIMDTSGMGLLFSAGTMILMASIVTLTIVKLRQLTRKGWTFAAMLITCPLGVLAWSMVEWARVAVQG